MEAFMPTPSLSYLVKEAVVRYSNSRRREVRRLTGLKLSEREARAAWPRVLEHKWYLSERLGRDVGVRVAAVDYFDNIEPPRTRAPRRASLGSLPPKLPMMLRFGERA
ncbi:MAG TPA: DUF4032 domain-containing protein [Pyrinomonadaceae bacterium]|nr:DUF4032 domain-containing protein [Pyrinomonadaceae bacterium]